MVDKVPISRLLLDSTHKVERIGRASRHVPGRCPLAMGTCRLRLLLDRLRHPRPTRRRHPYPYRERSWTRPDTVAEPARRPRGKPIMSPPEPNVSHRPSETEENVPWRDKKDGRARTAHAEETRWTTKRCSASCRSRRSACCSRALRPLGAGRTPGWGFRRSPSPTAPTVSGTRLAPLTTSVSTGPSLPPASPPRSRCPTRGIPSSARRSATPWPRRPPSRA